VGILADQETKVGLERAQKSPWDGLHCLIEYDIGSELPDLRREDVEQPVIHGQANGGSRSPKETRWAPAARPAWNPHAVLTSPRRLEQLGVRADVDGFVTHVPQGARIEVGQPEERVGPDAELLVIRRCVQRWIRLFQPPPK
jgi:hypothetical protein